MLIGFKFIQMMVPFRTAREKVRKKTSINVTMIIGSEEEMKYIPCSQILVISI